MKRSYRSKNETVLQRIQEIPDPIAATATIFREAGRDFISLPYESASANRRVDHVASIQDPTDIAPVVVMAPVMDTAAAPATTVPSIDERTDALVRVSDTVPVLMGMVERRANEETIHLYGNVAVAAYLRKTPEEIANKTLAEIGISAPLRALWESKLEECATTGESVSFEFDYESSRNSENKPHHYWSKASVWQVPADAQQEISRFAYLIEDITPYRTTEAALKESQRFLEKIAETTPAIWYVFDIQEKRSIYSNRGIGDILGYTPDEMRAMGDNVLDVIIHPDDLPMVRAKMSGQAFDTDGKVTQAEYRAIRKDGSRRWLSTHESPFERDPETRQVTQIIGVAEDVTERHEAEAALTRSEGHLRLAIEGADIGTFVADYQTNTIALSPHARRHLGLPQAQKTLQIPEMIALIYEEDRPAYEAAVAKTTRDNPHFTAEYRVRALDGSLRWGTTKAQIRFEDATGEPLQMIGICFDIEERKRAEATKALEADRQKRIAETLQRSLFSVAGGDTPLRSAVNRTGTATLSRREGVYHGWQVGLLYEPAWDEAQVGGDFYDVFALDDKRTAFVVGDVAGKGLDAAESVAEIKFGLRSFLRGVSDDPAFALSFLNDRQMEAQKLDGRSRERLFAVTIVVADNDTGKVRIARAGAELPIICRLDARGPIVRAVADIADLPIATLPETEYRVATETLARDEILLIYTDGLTDSFGSNPQTAAFSLDALFYTIRTALEASHTVPDPAVFCRRIVDTLDQVAPSTVRRDDTCIIAARRTI